MVLRGFLKFLGGLVAALLVLGIILGIVGFFMLRNFDPNLFRSELEKQLTDRTGFRVELGNIQLAWRPQPRLEVDGLKFFNPQTLEKLLESRNVRIDADLTSIWQKRFSLSQALIRGPEIFIKRDHAGNWNWQVSAALAKPVPMAPAASSKGAWIPVAEAAQEGKPSAMSSPSQGIADLTQGWEFSLGKVLVSDGTVHFVDETAEPSFLMDIKKLDAEVFQKSAAPSFHFILSGSVLDSVKTNLEAEGDLDLKKQSLDLVLRYGPEKATFKGSLKAVNNLPHFSGSLEVRDLEMDSVIPEVYKKGEYVSGRLSAQTDLALNGANPDAIKRSLQGQGTLEIKDGALRNRNVIKEVFDQLSPVLAVTNALGGGLPPEIHEMLKDRDTPFQSLQVKYVVQGGQARVSEFRLIHPNYQLAGQGSYGILDQRVDSSMQLVLSTAVSGYLTKKIHELTYLADKTGQVMIPFRYSGVFPDASVQPDLPYIGSRLLQSGADQLLNRGVERLSKALGGKKAGTASSFGGEQPVSEKEQMIQQGMDALSQILGRKKQ